MRTALKMTQITFAKALGTARSMLAACETDAKRGRPPLSLLIALGNVAAAKQLYDDAEWFWAEAGLQPQGMTRTVIALLKERGAPTTVGRRTGVPRNKIIYRDQDGPNRIDIQTDFLPDPLSCSFAIVPDESLRPLFNRNDVVVIDESETDLWKLVGDCVALYRAASWIRNVQEAREKLSDAEYQALSREMGARIDRLGLHVGWLRVSEREGAKSLLLESPTPFGGMAQEVVAFEIPPMPRSSTTRRIEVPAFTVLGRVTCWIDMRGKSLLSEPTAKANAISKAKKGRAK